MPCAIASPTLYCTLTASASTLSGPYMSTCERIAQHAPFCANIASATDTADKSPLHREGSLRYSEDEEKGSLPFCLSFGVVGS